MKTLIAAGIIAVRMTMNAVVTLVARMITPVAMVNAARRILAAKAVYAAHKRRFAERRVVRRDRAAAVTIIAVHLDTTAVASCVVRRVNLVASQIRSVTQVEFRNALTAAAHPDMSTVQCCDHQYCGSTGRCCHAGTTCNERGHCCNENNRFCSGGSAEACFPTNAVCCGDGTACPSDYPTCLVEGGTSGEPVCCPAGMNSMCGSICRPANYQNCACCGTSCCVAPFSCDGNGRCFHDYESGSWWCGYHHHHDEQGNDFEGVPAVSRLRASKINHSLRFLTHVLPEAKKIKTATNVTNPPIQLPPPPTQKIDPSSFACFKDAATMNDTCAAWDCLEEIMKCGYKGPIREKYELICEDFRDLVNFFNAEGQQFLKCTANCVTKEIVDIVRHTNIKLCCASLVLWEEDKDRFNCWSGCGFCTVYLTNHVGFKAIFDKASPGANANAIYSQYCHLG